jgi:hypothetical protein
VPSGTEFCRLPEHAKVKTTIVYALHQIRGNSVLSLGF